MVKKIAILGSTGSIGVQALEVIKKHPELFSVSVLTGGDNVDLLISQARAFRPTAVCIGNENHFEYLNKELGQSGIKLHFGIKGLMDCACMAETDVVLTALVGYAGLAPTLGAIDAGKTIALANKETLVVAGELVMKKAQEKGVKIIPVDSEHSAIFQCLIGEKPDAVEKVILTASGGPFRGKTALELKNVTTAQALNHPNWSMGAKITIDSASLMNKGLEVIEARWLFNLHPNQVEVIVHPQSVIHSMVQFRDSSVKAQLGIPDMKLPILYALGFPDRIESPLERIDFSKYGNLNFEGPDTKTFRNLALAFRAMEMG